MLRSFGTRLPDASTPAARRRPIATSALVLAVVLAACGGSDGSDAGEADSDAPQFGSEEFGLTMEDLTRRIESVEALIGECMREEGFEYFPVDFVTVRRAMLADKTAPGLSDEEYVAQFGYGISTQFDKPAVEIGLGEQNARVLENLTEADRVAYTRALWGENQEATFAVALEAEDFSEVGGCTLSAVEATFDADELSTTYINPGDALIEQDPRVISALEDWAECMRDEGFEFDHPDEVEEGIRERFAAIVEDQDPATLGGSALDALTELQGEERAVAQVDLECAEELLEPVIEEVEAEIYGAPPG